MRLVYVRLKNFRAYKDETTIRFSNLTSLIGKNDIGKSSILEALEIFFNSELIECQKDDLSVNADDNEIEITCIFSELPDKIIIDETVPTSLADEYLLNESGYLEITKIYSCSQSKPKEKVYIGCMHPSIKEISDLLALNIAQLKKRADTLQIDSTIYYDARISSQIRHAIRSKFPELNLQKQALLIDGDDKKKIFEALKKYLPTFALFQSDRSSRDDDKEVTDPMKLAVQQALHELDDDLEKIKEAVKASTLETANRTLQKLKEMSPELADSLIPEFRVEPKFDSQFKLTIMSDSGIPVNKRGSGVRRLILLNFFRAEAERRMSENTHGSIIYAFEEPETSQHPDHQKILLDSFLALSQAPQCQVILTTHTPALGGLLPLDGLRFIDNENSKRVVREGNDEIFLEICNSLGVLPEPIPSSAKAILLVEGKGDVIFIRHIADMLKQGGYIPNTLTDKCFALVPTGGCDNLKHWYTERIINQFQLPWCVLIDSDKGTAEEEKNTRIVENLRSKGIKAYKTRKREPENYISKSLLRSVRSEFVEFTDADDAKKIISCHENMNKDSILERLWPRMTTEQIREVEKYSENGNERFEFSEMISDFLSILG